MDNIILKGIIDEDFVNYGVPSMTIMFPKCNFKCGDSCQNIELADAKDIIIPIDYLCERYLNNDITKSIVCQGLEPMDSFEDLESLIDVLRTKYRCLDDIVIYTGYDKEIIERVDILSDYKNIIFKYGRYIPGQEPHYDDVLSVQLASDNQYAESRIKMNQSFKCPCCNDNEHPNLPYHDQLITQTTETTGAYTYVARYYFCPILQEMYEDEQLAEENIRVLQELINIDKDNRKQSGENTNQE